MAPPLESTLEIVGLAIPVFRVGPPQRPPIKHDDGFLGRFPRRQPTAADYAELSGWIARLEAGEAIQGIPFLPKNDLPDALAAYRHFLFGKGRDRTFSYERYVEHDPSGKVTLGSAITQAKLAAEELFWLRRSKPDEANGKFELTGLGHQYTNYSTLSRMVRWTALSHERTRSQVTVNAGSRPRRPADNRRLRNRL
jgi:hypothetical protein